MVTCSKTGMYYARGQWVQADGERPRHAGGSGL